jgi:formate dehydrogenase subunit gamma
VRAIKKQENAMATKPASPQARRSRRRRIAVWSLVTILAGALLLPLGGYVYVNVVQAAPAQAPAASAAEQQTNPRANYWRAVRDGFQGYTAASGPYTTNVLIQNGGQNWRQLRNGPVASLLSWLMALMVLGLGAYYILHGPVKVSEPLSGRTVERFTYNERVLHWYTAVLFILLAITGLSLMLGRELLIPWMGLKAFAAYANIAVVVHNYLGPLFIVGVVLEILMWARIAIPNKVDVEWFKAGGGYFGHAHPSAGKLNAGEKIFVFWTATVGMGILISISGLVLDFPNLGFTRETMQNANLIHGIAAIIYVTIILMHMYLGSIGVHGALDAMTSGRVSVEWAKEHHDLWYEEVKGTAGRDEGKSAGGVPRTA